MMKQLCRAYSCGVMWEMDWFADEKIVAVPTVLAFALAEGRSDEEALLIQSVLTQTADTLQTIIAVRQLRAAAQTESSSDENPRAAQ